MELVARRNRAWAVAHQAASLLRQQFGATRIRAFGSLVRPDRFTRWSDIDLIAYDLSPREYYRAVAAVSGLSPEFKIDLVDPSTCSPALLNRIEREGRDIEPLETEQATTISEQ